MHFEIYPLTCLAPADESARCEPSPPRGRGLNAKLVFAPADAVLKFELETDILRASWASPGR